MHFDVCCAGMFNNFSRSEIPLIMGVLTIFRQYWCNLQLNHPRLDNDEGYALECQY